MGVSAGQEKTPRRMVAPPAAEQTGATALVARSISATDPNAGGYIAGVGHDPGAWQSI